MKTPIIVLNLLLLGGLGYYLYLYMEEVLIVKDSGEYYVSQFNILTGAEPDSIHRSEGLDLSTANVSISVSLYSPPYKNTAKVPVDIKQKISDKFTDLLWLEFYAFKRAGSGAKIFKNGTDSEGLSYTTS
jgi:hypothetical protein